VQKSVAIVCSVLLAVTSFFIGYWTRHQQTPVLLSGTVGEYECVWSTKGPNFSCRYTGTHQHDGGPPHVHGPGPGGAGTAPGAPGAPAPTAPAPATP